MQGSSLARQANKGRLEDGTASHWLVATGVPCMHKELLGAASVMPEQCLLSAPLPCSTMKPKNGMAFKSLISVALAVGNHLGER